LYDPNLWVYTAWDIGLYDHMSIVFYQVKGDWINFIDCYENQNYDVRHYIDIINSKPYEYAEHFLPYDAKRRDAFSEGSRIERAERDYGMSFSLLDPCRSIIEDINRVRREFYSVRIREETCGRLLQCLDCYRKEYDAKNGVFKDVPQRNEFLDMADAFRYAMMSIDKIGHKRTDVQHIIQPTYNHGGTAWMA
jgi:hypothetical protein